MQFLQRISTASDHLAKLQAYNLGLLEKVEHDIDTVILYFDFFWSFTDVLVEGVDVQYVLVMWLKIR